MAAGRFAAAAPRLHWALQWCVVLLLLQQCAGADSEEAAVGVDASGAQVDDTGEFELLDHAGTRLAGQPKWTAFNQRCRQAVKKALVEPANAGTPSMLTLYPDPMTGVSVEPRSSPGDVRVVYVVLASRASAASVVSRLVRALYHPSHLFLVHTDLKTNSSTHERLQGFAAARPNVHVLKTRRLVQWAGFSMVLALLDALSSFVGRLDFDFVIPISDGELALRTNEEMVAFLGRFRGRSMVRVAAHEEGGRLGTSEARHADHDLLGRYPVIECGGFGFVTVNATLPKLDPKRPCCFGGSGPLVEATVPFEPPRPAEGALIYRGSQWGVLSAELATYLVRDPAAHRWGRILERRLLADELFLPTGAPRYIELLTELHREPHFKSHLEPYFKPHLELPLRGGLWAMAELAMIRRGPHSVLPPPAAPSRDELAFPLRPHQPQLPRRPPAARVLRRACRVLGPAWCRVGRCHVPQPDELGGGWSAAGAVALRTQADANARPIAAARV